MLGLLDSDLFARVVDDVDALPNLAGERVRNLEVLAFIERAVRRVLVQDSVGKNRLWLPLAMYLRRSRIHCL